MAKSYIQMQKREREEVFLLRNQGKSLSEIAQALSRSKSTISRELARNTVDQALGYLPDTAHQQACLRTARHGFKVNRHPELKNAIILGLHNKLSPEVIAGRRKQQGLPLLISTEAIYQFIYSEEGKKAQLFKLLLKARPRRGMHGGRQPRSTIPDRISIHDRPKDVDDRKTVGHFEGDLTFFKGNLSINIGVIVERKTRLVRLIRNTSKYSSTVMKGMFNVLAALPESFRSSITFDNGSEFTKHTALKRFMDMDTYFCDKRSPWQKGQVEQMNVMLHRYLPKKSNIQHLTERQLKRIEDQLNNRPRKCLGFKTPAEVFKQELSQSVALRP